MLPVGKRNYGMLDRSPRKQSTYKLLCLSIIGRLENAEVNSAKASNALNSNMKNSTPPLGKTPNAVDGRLKKREPTIKD